MRIHRTTWVALPILALVIAGTGTGWWGYQQQQQKQALAVHVANSYSSAFHTLTADVEQAHQTIGEALVTSDQTMLSKRLQTVARLSFAANGEVARLPADALPDGHVQAFTENLGTFAQRQAANTTPTLRTQLATYWKQTGQLVSSLHQLSPDVGGTHQVWLSTVQPQGKIKPGAASSANASFLAGLRQLDASAGRWSTAQTNAITAGSGHNATDNPKAGEQARVTSEFSAFTGTSRVSQWQVQGARGAGRTRIDLVQGTTSEGPIYGSVVPSTDQVLSFHIDRTLADKPSIDLAEATRRARHWLEARHFPPVESTGVSQFDNSAYCTFAPLYRGVPVIDQEIVVNVGLDRGDVIGYQGTRYDQQPLTRVPARLLGIQQLKRQVSSALDIHETRTVVALDDQHHPQPAVAFYGTSHGETYCVVMNANTGREIRITQLTNHL